MASIGKRLTVSAALALALEQLGFGPAQHYMTLENDPERTDRWIRAWAACVEGKAKFTRKDWDETLRDTVVSHPGLASMNKSQLTSTPQSICDFPAGAFADELAEHYPDVKIIINYRDIESWVQSVKETIWKRPTPGNKIYSLVGGLLPWSIGDHKQLIRLKQKQRCGPAYTHDIRGMRKLADRETHLRRLYHRHYAYMDRCMPPERTIRWTPQDGWEPLCQHLGVPVPPTPFPHTNTTQQFMNYLKHHRPVIRLAWSLEAGVTMMVVVVLAAVISVGWSRQS